MPRGWSRFVLKLPLPAVWLPTLKLREVAGNSFLSAAVGWNFIVPSRLVGCVLATCDELKKPADLTPVRHVLRKLAV